MIDLERISYLANLARLKLSPEEATRMCKELDSIVHYVESLQNINLGDVEPMTHAVPMKLPTRADKPQEQATKVLLEACAQYADGFVVVPKIIE